MRHTYLHGPELCPGNNEGEREEKERQNEERK